MPSANFRYKVKNYDLILYIMSENDHIYTVIGQLFLKKLRKMNDSMLALFLIGMY